MTYVQITIVHHEKTNPLTYACRTIADDKGHAITNEINEAYARAYALQLQQLYHTPIVKRTNKYNPNMTIESIRVATGK